MSKGNAEQHTIDTLNVVATSLEESCLALRQLMHQMHSAGIDTITVQNGGSRGRMATDFNRFLGSARAGLQAAINDKMFAPHFDGTLATKLGRLPKKKHEE